MSSSTGMKISPELQNDWQQLKKGQLKWLIIKSQVAGDESAPLVTDASGDANSTHDQLWARVPKDEPRVVLYNLKFSITTSDGAVQPKNKILVVSWVPNGLSGMRGLKLKMLATSATNTIKDGFQIAHLVQACSDDEFTLDAFLDKAKRFERDPVVEGSWS